MSLRKSDLKFPSIAIMDRGQRYGLSLILDGVQYYVFIGTMWFEGYLGNKRIPACVDKIPKALLACLPEIIEFCINSKLELPSSGIWFKQRV